MRLLLLSLLLLPAAGHAQQAPVASSARLEFTEPPFPIPAALRDSVRFGWLTVPQDHDDPAAGTIRLAVAVIAPRTAQPAPDPIVLIPGGPGDAQVEPSTVAIASSPRVGLHRLHRAVVVLDPRGHGLSGPNVCAELNLEAPLIDDAASDAPALTTGLAACRHEAAASGVRLHTLSSRQAALDLEYLRRALGAPALNLIGASYGTRIAATAVYEVPRAVRAVMLHGPVAPPHTEARVPGDAVLRLLFRRCMESVECNRAYPHLARDHEIALSRAARTPSTLRVPAGDGRRVVEVRVDSAFLAEHLPELAYSRALVAVAPLLIHTMAEEGLGPMTLLASRLRDTFLSAIRYSTHLAFRCNDEMPYASMTLRRSCEALLGHAPVVQRSFLRADIPALIMTGELDTRTTTEDAYRLAETMSRAQVVVIPWYGHEGLPDCAFRVTDAFLITPDRAADTTCMDRVPPVRFVTDVVTSRWAAKAASLAVSRPVAAALPVTFATVLLGLPFFLLPVAGRKGQTALPALRATCAWITAALGLALIGGTMTALLSAAGENVVIPLLGVQQSWSWVLVLPWLLLASLPCTVAVAVGAVRARPRRSSILPCAAAVGAALLLAFWTVLSLNII